MMKMVEVVEVVVVVEVVKVQKGDAKLIYIVLKNDKLIRTGPLS